MSEALNIQELEKKIHRGMDERRILGAFYTPSNLSSLLCEWAIRDAGEVILEPSFGGCTFLEEIERRFESLGNSDSARKVYGCDIDPHAFETLDNLELKINRDNFLCRDFLSISHKDFCKVDVVIGNPPYVRYSQITIEQRDTIAKLSDSSDVVFGARSSLWSYFLIHSLRFLKEGGRLAFVLPGSFLTADYAKNVHEVLLRHFNKVLVVSLSERIFVSEGAEERTVILLADNYSSTPLTAGEMKIAHVRNVSELKEVLESTHQECSKFFSAAALGFGSFVESSIINKFQAISADYPCLKFSDWARVSIGIVTGDTKFFIRKSSEWASLGIGSDNLEFVVPKIKGINGLDLTPSRIDGIIKSDARCLLLATPASPLPLEVIRYLNKYPDEKKSSNATFKKRKLWYNPDDGRVPNGVASFLTHKGPRVILNTAKVNATNSVYRIYSKSKTNKTQQKLIALSFLSTFTQLYAEIIGRPCGSGALKLEPKDFLKLLLIIPENVPRRTVEHYFARADKSMLLAPPDEDAARLAADEFLEEVIGETYTENLSWLRKSLNSARESRWGK